MSQSIRSIEVLSGKPRCLQGHLLRRLQWFRHPMWFWKWIGGYGVFHEDQGYLYCNVCDAMFWFDKRLRLLYQLVKLE